MKFLNKIPYLTNEEFLDIACKLSKNPDYLKSNKLWVYITKIYIKSK